MSKVISISEVSKHQEKNSVWLIIHNDVYDVTKFLDEHPGGEEALLDFAGKEATQGFEDVGHSEDARELLKKFKIGTLPKEERDRAAAPNAASTAAASWPGQSKEQKVPRSRLPEPAKAVVVPSGSNWKWYLLLLLGAIAIGVLIKKKMAA